MSMSRVRQKLRAMRSPALLATFLLACWVASCDSGFTPERPPSSEGVSPTALVQAWYEESLDNLQEERLGKYSNAEILEAFVRQYPPDWSQAVEVPLADGSKRVITVLGPGQPNTTHSHAKLGVVRTLSVDVNPSGEVVGSRLLEFVSPDTLDAAGFADYVGQWEDRDFGDLRMLTSEYDIAYESRVCEVYTPGEGFKTVDVTLEEVSGMGKTAATWYCWGVGRMGGLRCGPLL